MRLWLLLPILFAPGLASAPPAWGQPASFTVDALMRRLAAVPQRRASFREEKTLAALAQPLVSWGRLSYRQPDHLEKDTTTPAPERLVVDGSRLVLTAGSEPPRALDLDRVPELRALVDTVRGTLSGDLSALQRGFAVSLAGQPDAWQMTLTPVDPRVAKLVARVLIEGAGAEPLRITTAQANGDTDRLDITPEP